MAPINKQEAPGFIALISNTLRLTEAGNMQIVFKIKRKKQPNIFDKYYNS